jgi:hypothetical protein
MCQSFQYRGGINQCVPLQRAWAKTVHSLQGHNAGPAAANQRPNAIQIISVNIGQRKDETLNPGLTYMAISRATTIRNLGHVATIPRKCTNSAIYFLGGTFQVASNVSCVHIPTKNNIQRSKSVQLGLHIWINRRKKTYFRLKS